LWRFNGVPGYVIDIRVAQLSNQTGKASNNVAVLSAAIEEITASTSEIGNQFDYPTRITNEAVDEMTGTVTHIGEATNRTTEVSAVIDELENNMQLVSEIITIIQDISECMSILAINVPIEAFQPNRNNDSDVMVTDKDKNSLRKQRTPLKILTTLSAPHKITPKRLPRESRRR